MARISRREFMKHAALGAGALAATGWKGAETLTRRNPGSAVQFRAYPDPSMPVLDFAYLADEHDDPFKSPVRVTPGGVEVPPGASAGPFSVNARWFVPGFGYLWLGADNEGRLFSTESGSPPLNLAVEFARSRVARNRRVLDAYARTGTKFTGEVTHLGAIADELLHDALRPGAGDEQAGKLANRALYYALSAGERIEIEQAESAIARFGVRDVQFGCETRQFVWARSDEMERHFTQLFNFATITHYVWDSWYELFEPREGVYNWGIKDDIARWLSEHDIAIEGRPLFWFHPTVTPDWLKAKSFDQLKSYVEKHTHDLVTHYGDRVLQWEVFNEYHDWANIHRHTPEQITELTRLGLERTKEENPRVVRLLNNCAPWGEYVARGRQARMEANRPLRTVRKYLTDLRDAGVDYDVLGLQIYFPQRDLSDIARLLDRFETFGKPLYITEIGASANMTAPAPSGAVTAPPAEPFAWHRPWDEDLQADWLEQVYKIYYSRRSVVSISWYDFSDFRPFIVNGGLVREDSTPKKSFERLRALLSSWNKLPRKGEL